MPQALAAHAPLYYRPINRADTDTNVL